MPAPPPESEPAMVRHRAMVMGTGYPAPERAATRLPRAGRSAVGRGLLLWRLAGEERRRPVVQRIPLVVVAVVPLRIALKARAHPQVELVLLGRVRVLEVQLLVGEAHDHQRATGLPLFPQDLGADEAGDALALVVPLLSEHVQLADLVRLHLDARDRSVHLDRPTP